MGRKTPGSVAIRMNGELSLVRSHTNAHIRALSAAKTVR
jgi:hypothetical protein